MINASVKLFNESLHFLTCKWGGLTPPIGVDIVFGCHWLLGLVPILFYYGQLRMAFNYKGLPHALPTPISPSQLNHELTLGSFTHLFCLTMVPDVSTASIVSPPPDPDLQHLLPTYHHLFEAPKSLPPPGLVDHQIPLQPSTDPIKVHHY